MNPKLTIGIPVYMGADYIYDLVSSIQKYNNNDDIIILIHENYSSDNIDLNLIDNKKNLEYKLHDTNFGFDYNILSLYESFKTEYIWFLGCDDKVLPNSVLSILNLIKIHQFDAMIINWNGYNYLGEFKYNKGILYPKTIIENSQLKYFNKLGPQFFISSYILKKKNISLSKTIDYYGFSHFLLFTKVVSLDNLQKIIFTPDILVTHISGLESYVNVWIKVFLISYPKFINEFIDSKDLKSVFLSNNSYTISTTKNIIYFKGQYSNQVSFSFFVQIFKINYRLYTFYLYCLIPLLLPSRFCKYLLRYRNK